MKTGITQVGKSVFSDAILTDEKGLIDHEFYG
jgi:hypothetical protein